MRTARRAVGGLSDEHVLVLEMGYLASLGPYLKDYAVRRKHEIEDDGMEYQKFPLPKLTKRLVIYGNRREPRDFKCLDARLENDDDTYDKITGLRFGFMSTEEKTWRRLGKLSKVYLFSNATEVTAVEGAAMNLTRRESDATLVATGISENNPYVAERPAHHQSQITLVDDEEDDEEHDEEHDEEDDEEHDEEHDEEDDENYRSDGNGGALRLSSHAGNTVLALGTM